MIKAVLSNKGHPEYGVATIPFPIPREEYGHVVEMAEALEIGGASKRDCHVDEIISGAWPVLKRLENTQVNLDELDYLAKRLDSFDTGEAAQFQAMAEKLDLHGIADLINLTFCCQQATVITDFSDLEAIGRAHYLNINSGCAGTEEFNALDGYETALLLIGTRAGAVTPYGVVYDNGMKLAQVYDGKHLPCYLYDPEMLVVGLTSRSEPENTGNITWIYLPAAKEQIDRALLRSGITNPSDMRFLFDGSQFPEEVNAALDFEKESIHELNELASAVEKLTQEGRAKLGAAVAMAGPESAAQIRHLAENLDLFDFAPDTHSPAEYGKYMIQKSGHFGYDPHLEEFYDYEKYGVQHMSREYGAFTDRGYIAYQGTLSLDELMMEDPAEQFRQEMGGMA